MTGHGRRGFKPGQVPDFTVPTAARMYDYYLGGKDNSPADREAAKKVISAYPETRRLAQANRRFLTRAAWYLADHGIRQFIDLGSGLPTSPNVHEVARQARPDARVVYVDSDPVVASHGRAMCDTDHGVTFAEYDIRYPQDIINDAQVASLIDFSVPLAVLCVAVLHFIPDSDNPAEVIAAFRSAMAPGSYLVLSHAASDGADDKLLSEIRNVYKTSTAPAVPRAAADIERFFTGFELIEPGLVDAARWRSDMRVRPTKIRFLAGVGRKLPDLPKNCSHIDSKKGWAGILMSQFHCSCGFAVDDAESLGDHFGIVFARDDDNGLDGLPHAEVDSAGTTGHWCSCGFEAADVPELDDHLLMVVIPADGIDHDGVRHVLIDTATPLRWCVGVRAGGAVSGGEGRPEPWEELRRPGARLRGMSSADLQAVRAIRYRAGVLAQEYGDLLPEGLAEMLRDYLPQASEADAARWAGTGDHSGVMELCDRIGYSLNRGVFWPGQRICSRRLLIPESERARVHAAMRVLAARGEVTTRDDGYYVSDGQ
jgi:hypothetical protein